ncbi:MAG TPA: hypothetical protein VGL59_05135 [Polyangia bacterium]
MTGRVRRSSWTFLSVVTASFGLGWLLGLAVVLKAWNLSHAPRWSMFGGAGHAAFMLLPVVSGILVTRVAGHLFSRGWSGTPVRFLVLGVCLLLAGVLVI